jgi:hypothetical protein
MNLSMTFRMGLRKIRLSTAQKTMIANLPAQEKDELALRTAMLISEQETEFGINMYQVVSKDDDMEIKALLNRGFTIDEAILWLFEHRGYKSKRAINAENQQNPINNNDEEDSQSRSTLTRSVVDEVRGYNCLLSLH